MRISKIFDEHGLELARDIWVTKKQNYSYLNVEEEQGICSICRKKRSLKAHHIIPKRLKAPKPLDELRIKICNNCHNKIHPENILIIAMKKLIKIIDELTDNGADKIEVVKEFKEVVYNTKYKDGIPYNHLEKINKNLEKKEDKE